MSNTPFSKNISLKKYNTFGIDACAERFVDINSIENLKAAIGIHSNPIFLGGGSNILFMNAIVSTPLVKLSLKGIEVLKETNDAVWICAKAGEIWHDLVMYCVNNGYGGIENLSLIPGSVGAAPMQNIGAYGVEIKDVFVELEALNLENGDIKKFSLKDCAFDYRYSVFKGPLKNKFCIVSVTLKLLKNPVINSSYGAIEKTLKDWNINQPTIKDISNAVIKIRQGKLPDPNEIGNAGSFFKNPIIDKNFLQNSTYGPKLVSAPQYVVNESFVKIPAGWLIEQCGWRGKRVGNTGSHKDQALVIVNYGNATGQEIWNHAQNVQRSVFETFGIKLEPEVNLVD